VNYTSKALSAMVEKSEQLSVLFILLHVWLNNYHILQEFNYSAAFIK